MSDTPETDDLARGNHVVPTEWAEQLERERDDARLELKGCKAKNKRISAELLVKLQDIDRDINEARHEIEGWRNKWECAVDMAARAENQRNEYKALLIRIYNDINVLHTGEAIRELTREFRDENFN
jgi:hypothetical protein